MKTISSEKELVRLFFSLIEREKSQKLLFSGQKQTKEIAIQKGQILYATSNLLKDKLSEILFKAGKLTREQHLLSTELSIVTRKRIGEIILREACVTADEIAAGLRHQARQVVAGLFERPQWILRCRDLGPEPPPAILPGLSVAGALMAGLRSVDNLAILYEAMPPAEAVLEVVPERQDLAASIGLSREENLLLSLVDGWRTVATLREELRLLEYRFAATLYPLLALGLVRGRVRSASPRQVRRLATPSAGRSRPIAAEVPEAEAEEVLEQAKILISSEEYAKAASLLTRLIRSHGKKAAYYYYLGLALDHLPGRNKEAEKVLKMAIRLQNYNPRYYLALGYLYLQRDMVRQAREQFLQARRWDPNDPYVREALENLQRHDRGGPSSLLRILGK